MVEVGEDVPTGVVVMPVGVSVDVVMGELVEVTGGMEVVGAVLVSVLVRVGVELRYGIEVIEDTIIEVGVADG